MADLKPEAKSSHSEREERVLSYWNEKGIFKKSVDRAAPRGDFVFYDGPPFATGLPHFGHVLPTSIKDAVPRYKTMQGYRVRRRWGWDCHGLPVENIIERELGLKSKKDIVAYGVKNFNEAARAAVHRYVNDWKEIIPRLGRWADMDDDYETMNPAYTESVWWAFKELHKKGLVYEGFKPMQICPHCETTLSNFEVAQGYKDIKDVSVYAKFQLEGEPGTSLVAWTTTPWTLPGNVALAVGKDIEYVKAKTDAGVFILAKERLSALKDKKYEVIGSMKGSELVGRPYKPLFDYYSNDKSLTNRDNGWKVYAADFVTTTDGTGIVHIAPAFGADDYALGQKENLPFVQHVSKDGTFKPEATDFAGEKVKPRDTAEDKDAHLRTDLKVLRWLDEHGALFAKENITHSYPHCWRCDTPLLNYAASSWFVRVTDFKDKLVSENKKVKWTPAEVGEGRFGNWLENARDWAISRSRFWGAPIPVWREEKSGKIHVVGSVDELKKYSKAKNTYYVMRHGEAENNVENILSSKPTNPHNLTDKGREQVRKGAQSLQHEKIDLIIASDFLRTKQTAEITADALGLPKDKILFDPRIREFDAGSFDGQQITAYHLFIGSFADGFVKRPDHGENYYDVKRRIGGFLYDMEARYSGKRILFVSHETPLWTMFSIMSGLNVQQSIRLHGERDDFIKNAEVRKLDFHPIPHDANYELDLHRPYIDEVELRTPSGDRLVRVEDVFDCWFESGSMPYGEAHYPFEKDAFSPARGFLSNILGKSRGYPADFIAEGLDQTRGWFYSMLVLGTALFGRSPYKNVVVNGIVLAEDGQKMAKSKANYPDLLPFVERYGADALRYYLLSSPLVRAQEFCFSEKGVDEVAKKHIGRLLNVISFYEMYAEFENGSSMPRGGEKSFSRTRQPSEKELVSDRKGRTEGNQNVLDKWILSRLNQLNREVTAGMETYELDRATRPFADFIDDLSTWYLRRSRDRFKGDDAADKAAALSTTRFALVELSKLLAPFMPFLAEEIYLKLNGGLESVHLEKWPAAGAVDDSLLANMKEVRKLSSLGLEARMKAKLNVRQPLAKLSVKGASKLDPASLELVKDEVNVKDVVLDAKISGEVELDTVLTAELKEEGAVRELLRAVQDERKNAGLSISDMAVLKASAEGASKEFIERNKASLMKSAGLKSISYGSLEGGTAVSAAEFSFQIRISA